MQSTIEWPDSTRVPTTILVKPFALDELLARLRALTRRADDHGDLDGAASLRRPGPRSQGAPGSPRREANRTDPDGVPAAGTVPEASRPGALTKCHLRECLGVRLRQRVELARRVHRLPATQAGSRLRASAASHRAWCGVRAARGLGCPSAAGSRLAAAGAVAVAVLMASVAAYLVMRSELRGQVDDSLRDRARVFEELSDDGGPPLTAPPPGVLLGGATGYVQLVSPDGHTSRPAGGRRRAAGERRDATASKQRR